MSTKNFRQYKYKEAQKVCYFLVQDRKVHLLIVLESVTATRYTGEMSIGWNMDVAVVYVGMLVHCLA